MQREPWESSTIRSVGYDPASALLEVEFTSGAIYRYFMVPAETYRAFERAASKGAFLNAVIKPGFPCRKVR